MTARARKKPELRMPPLACQIAGCGAEYAAIGDYADTLRAAELGGWRYCIFDDNGQRLIGAWVCPDHRHVLPWWPGRRIAPALPRREPGATTRAEFVGVVPRDVSWSTAALPAPEPDLEPLPQLPQRTPAGAPAHPWQAAMEAELSEQALAGGVPLESLAPVQEDEADA